MIGALAARNNLRVKNARQPVKRKDVYYRQQFWGDPFISDLNPSTIDGSGESAWTNWWSYMQARKLVTMTTLWAATTRHHHTENLSGEFGKYLSTLIHRLREGWE